MKLYVKNLISPNCKIAAKTEIEKMGLHCISAESGELEIQEEISEEQYYQIKKAFRKFGFELLKDKKSLVVEKIKKVILDSVHYPNEQIKVKFSDHLSNKINCSYRSLAKKFLEVQGTTIEKYLIECKIEKVKKMLLRDELSLTEIAYQLNYSSVAHLSNQFKKVAGKTPSCFKETAAWKRAENENPDNSAFAAHGEDYFLAEAV